MNSTQKPISVLSNGPWRVVTFVWPNDLATYVGYRINEYDPIQHECPLEHPPSKQKAPTIKKRHPLQRSIGWLNNWQASYEDGSLTFQAFDDGSAEIQHPQSPTQQIKVILTPEANGVRVSMTLTTTENITGTYILTQCLRFGDGILPTQRKSMSAVPFLSEHLMQMAGNANGTLTWHRQQNQWQPFPVPFTRYHTPAALSLEDGAASTDQGLIVRETPPRSLSPASYQQLVAPDATWETFSAGWYWERAVSISNRHPADCLHVNVDFGPLETGASRTVCGKFYWVEGTKDDLLALVSADFPQ